uniref:Zinc finger C2HC domain-containing protein 1B n=2 Tax=Mesocestoides corti TaxID=53468 RepID=A0A5K3FF81_MESCO
MQFDENTQNEFPLMEDFQLVPCTVCSRKFRTDIITKHENICRKASKRKLKIFDSGKMRAAGTGIPLNKTIRPGEVVPREPNKDERLIRAEKKRDNWRAKHLDFINTIRSAKAYQQSLSKGCPLPPPPPPASTAADLDLVRCEYCNRKFNVSAADRHIPFCKEKSERDRIKRSANKPTKQPIPKPGASKINAYQQKADQSDKTTAQQRVKSTSSAKEGNTDGAISNTTRHRGSPTSVGAPAKKPPSRPQSQSRSVLPAASSSEAGLKYCGRYENFNAGCLYDKPHSPSLSPEPEDACNNTFDVDDSQFQVMDYADAPKSDRFGTELPRSLPLPRQKSHRTPSAQSVASRDEKYDCEVRIVITTTLFGDPTTKQRFLLPRMWIEIPEHER